MFSHATGDHDPALSALEVQFLGRGLGFTGLEVLPDAPAGVSEDGEVVIKQELEEGLQCRREGVGLFKGIGSAGVVDAECAVAVKDFGVPTAAAAEALDPFYPLGDEREFGADYVSGDLYSQTRRRLANDIRPTSPINL